MKLLAENRFTITKALFLEGMLRVSRESYGPFARKAMIVLAVLWAVLAAVTVGTGGSPVYAGIELIVLALAGLWLCVYVPRRAVLRAWKAMGEKGDLHRVIRFYPDWLEVDNDSGETTVFYQDVERLLSTAHLLVLTGKDRVGVLIALDGFTQGDGETVRAAISRGMEGKTEQMIESSEE